MSILNVIFSIVFIMMAIGCGICLWKTRKVRVNFLFELGVWVFVFAFVLAIHSFLNGSK